MRRDRSASAPTSSYRSALRFLLPQASHSVPIMSSHGVVRVLHIAHAQSSPLCNTRDRLAPWMSTARAHIARLTLLAVQHWSCQCHCGSDTPSGRMRCSVYRHPSSSRFLSFRKLSMPSLRAAPVSDMLGRGTEVQMPKHAAASEVSI